MLKERNNFAEDLPVNVLTADIEDYPGHFHDDIEVIYVIDGDIELRNGYYIYKLSKGDVFVINDREIHGFKKISQNNMIMILRVSLDYFETYYKNLRNSFFIIPEKNKDTEQVRVIRETMARIMMDFLKKGYGYEHKVIESTHNLITCLLTNFQVMDSEGGDEETKYKGKRILTTRLRRITDYMYENYRKKITLNELAELEHLSIYYLSHVIKEATGLSFQELLSFIRVDESEGLLLNTDKKIGAISKEVGFSALRYYTKHFEQWFLCSPQEYRQRAKEQGNERYSAAKFQKCSARDIEEAIKNSVSGIYREYIKAKRPEPHIVEIDFLSEEIPFKNDVVFIGDLMPGENLKFIERPYSLFKSLNEKIVASGMNYIISAVGDENSSSVDKITVLLYNINDDKKRELVMAERKEQVFEICDKHSEYNEFLIQFKGVFGEFNITRYKLSKENIAAAYKELIRETGIAERRETLLSSWATIPSIEFANIKVAGNFNLRSTMTGISAEMILMDRK